MAADDVTLTDLEVIARWSLAVRQAHADRAELVAALRSDLDWLEGRAPRGDDEPSADDEAAAPAPAARKRTARKTTTRSTTRRRAAQ